MAAFATVRHQNAGSTVETIILTATANATYDFAPEHPIRAMSMMAKGGGGNNFGGGTVELLGSNDGTNFVSLPTAKTINADGIKSVAIIDCGFLNYRVALTGSTNPTLSIYVNLNNNHRRG